MVHNFDIQYLILLCSFGIRYAYICKQLGVAKANVSHLPSWFKSLQNVCLCLHNFNLYIEIQKESGSIICDPNPLSGTV